MSCHHARSHPYCRCGETTVVYSCISVASLKLAFHQSLMGLIIKLHCILQILVETPTKQFIQIARMKEEK